MWQVTARVLERLIAMTIAQGVGFTLINVRTQNQLLGRVDDQTRQKLLQLLATQLGVEYSDREYYYTVNFRQPFRANDGHWNETGHRFVADLINRAIIDGL